MTDDPYGPVIIGRNQIGAATEVLPPAVNDGLLDFGREHVIGAFIPGGYLRWNEDGTTTLLPGKFELHIDMGSGATLLEHHDDGWDPFEDE